jgi:hypothetical protein
MAVIIASHYFAAVNRMLPCPSKGTIDQTLPSPARQALSKLGNTVFTLTPTDIEQAKQDCRSMLNAVDSSMPSTSSLPERLALLSQIFEHPSDKRGSLAPHKEFSDAETTILDRLVS